MAQPYVGEIRMFGGNFAPAGWMFCEGQLLPISDYDTLFQLIGTTYGGDGQSTFALPDLRGRLPIHMGTGQSTYTIGQNGGVEQVTLTANQIPAHSHPFLGSLNAGIQHSSVGFMPAASNVVKIYAASAPSGNLAAQALLSDGGSQPHNNFQP